jgi:hypothetical protein
LKIISWCLEVCQTDSSLKLERPGFFPYTDFLSPALRKMCGGVYTGEVRANEVMGRETQGPEHTTLSGIFCPCSEFSFSLLSYFYTPEDFRMK